MRDTGRVVAVHTLGFTLLLILLSVNISTTELTILKRFF